MEYNHNEHAGSVADVWKHAQLTTAVSRIAHENLGLFTYLDTHCAYGVYRVNNKQYPGSWTAVDGALLARDNPHRIVVSDTDPKVIEAIDGTFGVEVHHKDGFELAKKLKSDFTFIDPTYVEDSDWGKVAYTCAILARADKSFMAWYPLMDDFKNNLFPDNMKRLEIYWGGSRRLKGCGLLVDDKTFEVLTNDQA